MFLDLDQYPGDKDLYYCVCHYCLKEFFGYRWRYSCFNCNSKKVDNK